jgi:hypothetical protein
MSDLPKRQVLCAGNSWLLLLVGFVRYRKDLGFGGGSFDSRGAIISVRFCLVQYKLFIFSGRLIPSEIIG